jgi:hypothetical protein
MFVNVTAIPIYASISYQDTNVLLEWNGGVPPYQLQTSTNLSSLVWQNLGSPTSATNILISPVNAGTFYRIQGQ